MIKLRGTAFNGTAGFISGPRGYFLIIDHLFDTLADRINRWAKHSAAKKGKRFSTLRRSLSLRRSLPIGRKDFSSSAPNPKKMSSSLSDIGDEQMDERLSVGKSC